jgi:hypothetical protein
LEDVLTLLVVSEAQEAARMLTSSQASGHFNRLLNGIIVHWQSAYVVQLSVLSSLDQEVF